nr:hypothetical protein Iba_chr04aCG18900 [Ipomoea batatas]
MTGFSASYPNQQGSISAWRGDVQISRTGLAAKTHPKYIREAARGQPAAYYPSIAKREPALFWEKVLGRDVREQFAESFRIEEILHLCNLCAQEQASVKACVQLSRVRSEAKLPYRPPCQRGKRKTNSASVVSDGQIVFRAPRALTVQLKGSRWLKAPRSRGEGRDTSLKQHEDFLLSVLVSHVVVRLTKVEQIALPDLALQPLVHNCSGVHFGMGSRLKKIGRTRTQAVEDKGLVGGDRVLGDSFQRAPRPLGKGRDRGVGVSLGVRRAQARLVSGDQCDRSGASSDDHASRGKTSSEGRIKRSYLGDFAFSLLSSSGFALVTSSEGSMASFHVSG